MAAALKSPLIAGLNPTEIRAELERVLAGGAMGESHQLRALLGHVVEETIEGREEGLKEYSLGRTVFHRPDHYDPRSDAIVRVQASLLRKKLEQYYAGEGASNPLRIRLPRGGYVPAFEPRPVEVAPEPPPAAVETASEPPRVSRRNFLPWVGGAAIGAACVGAAAWLRPSATVTKQVAAEPSDCPELWGAFFAKGAPAVVSFGVPLFYVGPEGLYVRDVQVNRPGEEKAGRLLEMSQKLEFSLHPQDDVYTGIGEFLGLHRVSTFLTERGVATQMANSHYLGRSDLNGKNLVVISSMRFQTLLGEMNLPRKFVFEKTGPGSVINLDPRPGESERYTAAGGAGVDTSFAIVSLWPGTTEGHRVLSLAGTHTWSTQAAAEWVLNARNLRSLHERLGRDGGKSPYFQVLLRAEGKNNIWRTAEYVTHRRL